MTKDKIGNENKNAELAKYRVLVIATLQYLLENAFAEMKTKDFNPNAYFESLKTQTTEHFQKGRLSKLKQCFRDFTEPQRETGDLNFNTYLKTKTGYDINIFQDFYTRIDKIVVKGKISTDNQFYDVNSMVNHLSQLTPTDNDKLKKLNNLLVEYEQRKAKKK